MLEVYISCTALFKCWKVYGSCTAVLYSIDYRCDDEKNTLELGRHLGIIVYLRTPGFPNCRSLTVFKHLFICKLKKTILLDCQSPTPTSQNSPFLVNRSADQELWISIFQGIHELVCSTNPNFLCYFYVLRTWGWDLTIMAGQPKTPIVTSIVYGGAWVGSRGSSTIRTFHLSTILHESFTHAG